MTALLIRSLAGFGGVILFSSVSFAAGFDPYGTQSTVSTSPAKTMLALEPGQDPCRFGDISTSIDLLEVVERSLCNHSQTRQAWANVKAQAAQVGISQSAYLPSVTATVGQLRVVAVETLDASQDAEKSAKEGFMAADDFQRRETLFA